MSGSHIRLSSYNTHRVSTDGEMQLRGAGQTLTPTGPFQTRAPSVYGGAGGYGTRISQSCFSSVPLNAYGGTAVITNEKFTMQNLNDRLASYLEKVRSLETANGKLELQIREFYERRVPAVSKDCTTYFDTIAGIRAQITTRYAENQSILLEIDNAKLATEDFKMRYETELHMRKTVDRDMSDLRGLRDSLTLTISSLEMQIESQREELVHMKSSHEEEMHQLRINQKGDIDVKVDSAGSQDLTKVMEEIREQYEALVLKNKTNIEKWYISQMEILEAEISVCTTDMRTFYMELSGLKRTYQSLEISLQSIFTEIKCMHKNMEELKTRYSVQLSQLQLIISTLETELQQLRVSIEQQQAEYSLLLDIKMRLELEIAEYRRLLDGQLPEKKAVIISTVVEEHKPHIERRVKTIVEEIIDGQVVSSTVETQVEDIQ